MYRYRAHSSKLRTTRKYWPSEYEAWEAFERACKRNRLPYPGHKPGNVSGDGWEKTVDGYCLSGVRDGHGYVFLEAISS